jgi:hypothetical protein
MCILRDAEVGFCVKNVVTYDNLDSIKFPLSKKQYYWVDISPSPVLVALEILPPWEI